MIFETIKGTFKVLKLKDDWIFALKFNYYGPDKYEAFPVDDNKYMESFGYIKVYDVENITEEGALEIVNEHKNCKRYFIKETMPQKYYDSASECVKAKFKGKHIFKI